MVIQAKCMQDFMHKKIRSPSLADGVVHLDVRVVRVSPRSAAGLATIVVVGTCREFDMDRVRQGQSPNVPEVPSTGCHGVVQAHA